MHKFGLLIGAPELSGLLGSPDLRVIDCRFNLLQPAEGRRQHGLGHIPGAVYADLEGDLSGPRGPDTGRHPLPDRQVLATTFGRLGIGDRTQVVVYDDMSGAIAARAWWLLRWLGHDRVAVLDGGFAAWKRGSGSVEEGAVQVSPANFSARGRGCRVIATPELESWLAAAGQGLHLVDARDAARYRGDQEPIDTVAGRIPRALNLPYSRILNADGRFRTPAEIDRAWEEVLGGLPEADYAVMCGSGVTACHLVLGALLAGREEPRLYAGSWSEWIREPSRAVARGPAGKLN